MPYKDKEKRYAYARDFNKQLYAQRREEWFAKNGPCHDCGSWENLRLSYRNLKNKVTHRVFMLKKERREEELAKCIARCWSCWVKYEINRKKQKPLPRNAGHGLNGYRKGCRCILCGAAHHMSYLRDKDKEKING
jgi:hypothetical protein